ncbi:pyruvate carboxylase [Bryobacter aggregatus]|uniref:pyruvate carboxylase n=1 Tax=Bryobacter aggregatus TaxID=360054 RepID=UPI00055C4B31|nr:pyruvate carboxylase [Bryobacter aggregatus]
MKKLLALNRGEIAIRIFRAANELGLSTVAIYSKEDRLSLHRFKADEAYQIGENKGPVEAYLDVDGIVALASSIGVDAIHPGYGFLSENPALPRACEKAGIAFVGPKAEMLDALGDKTAARTLAEKAKIPVVPGTPEAVTNIADAEKAAEKIGFPLIIKAAFGGGGRGMRVVNNADEFKGKLEEARREAGAAFGNDAVFLERFIRRAKHIEIQIIADKQGNVLHLFERDCSVQRRHQKVVEVAPAVNLSPRIRQELCDAAVALAKVANYENAGTVEFLVDVDRDEWFFIEVNPRVQVEHTVTEMVTGIDIVRTQIQVAQGLSLHSPEIGLPEQKDIHVNGFALQCRVTTEDASQNFQPDYGRIHTYRSPAGFGIRLDGASAYGGAVITPFYDSLLVKTTAWGRDFHQACQRMDRALREFRIRGVKTNIPFLENVINNDTFQKGDVTTRFLEETPELFQFTARRDRATKLLTYLGDVIVNGNPEAAGKPKPATFRKPRIEPFIATPAPAGTKQLLDKLGPEGFAQWTRDQKRLLITDTTFRDAHQSLMATRMRTYDLMAIANFVAHRMSGLYSLEMWGGATFDVSMRFLLEDPWQRLTRLREVIPNIAFQMLLRASNAVGYTAYPDNVVREFIKETAAQGIDIFRIFDSLNWLPNMQVAMEAVRNTDRICEAAICYSGDLLDPKRTKYSLNYYVKMAKELEKMGAHMLSIKDMAGLAKPYAIELLVKTLRQEIGIPIHFHTHDSSGLNAASILKASDAMVDIADAAVASMSGSTSQPNLNSIAASLANTERDTGLDPEALLAYSEYWEAVRHNYSGFDTSPRHGLADLYIHEMPGGQYTNLREQAEAMGLGTRWPEVARMYADVNAAFGDIIKVTPSSKVVGDLALFLLSHGMTMEEFLALKQDHNITLPNSVIDMFEGSLGIPEGGWPEQIAKIILQGRKTTEGRPGAAMAAVDLDETAKKLETAIEEKPSRTDLMSYLMYPEVFVKFAKSRADHGDIEVLPSPAFFYGMAKGEEISFDIEPGKTLIVKFLTISEPNPDGTRNVFFELNGQPREVQVKDKTLKSTMAERPKADPSNPGHVAAPIPGAVTTIHVKEGSEVKKGAPLLVLEAMKMQTTVNAPIDGTVKEILVKPGETVEPKDLLVILG